MVGTRRRATQAPSEEIQSPSKKRKNSPVKKTPVTKSRKSKREEEESPNVQKKPKSAVSPEMKLEKESTKKPKKSASAVDLSPAPNSSIKSTKTPSSSKKSAAELLPPAQNSSKKSTKPPKSTKKAEAEPSLLAEIPKPLTRKTPRKAEVTESSSVISSRKVITPKNESKAASVSSAPVPVVPSSFENDVQIAADDRCKWAGFLVGLVLVTISSLLIMLVQENIEARK
jgi:hypothetical protein